MKKTNLFILIGMLVMLVSNNLYAGESWKPLYFHAVSSPINDDDVIVPQKGHRIPSRPLDCSISPETGLSIPEVANEDFCLFEVYDENDIILASFCTEEDFIGFIYSYSGVKILRIYTQNYLYTGYIPE